MKLLEIFKDSDSNIQLDRNTLVVLRWIANIGQLITISIVYIILNFQFPLFYCGIIISLGILSNILLQFKEKNKLLGNFKSTSYLMYDLGQLSLLIFFTGGITNPFILLILIPAVVSSTFLSLKSTINLGILTFIFLILLTIFYFPLPSVGGLHFHVPAHYFYGIPIAITIGLFFLCYFGARFGLENRKRTEGLNKLELVLAKEHELKSIGVQAAAAAHSLSTPLSTIKLVSKELEKEMGNNIKFKQDVKILHDQAIRCGEILKKLSMTPLKRDDFFENVKLNNLLNEIKNSFQEISKKKISLNLENDEEELIIKRKAEITYGLRNFIGNASKFSDSLVEIKLESNKKRTRIIVSDDGPGFPNDIKNFLGEPYIHSKNKIIDSKSGMGLGVFIGKTLLERLKANVYFGKCPNNKGAMVTINWETKNLIST